VKIKYDARAKVAYISLTDITPSFGIVDHTQEITEDVCIDWMKDGTLFGIEVLDVPERPLMEE